MNSKHRKTLEAVFQKPTRADIRWTRIESLLKGLGADVSTGGQGSRVRVELNGQEATFHRPPRPTSPKYQVEALREFLNRAGVKP